MRGVGGIATARNSPLNQPIKTINAEVFLIILGTNFDNGLLSAPREIAGLRIRDRWGSSNINDIAVIMSDHFESHIMSYNTPYPYHANARDFSISFKWPSPDIGLSDQFRPYLFINQNRLSVNDLDKEKGIEIDIIIPGIETNMPIAMGGCSVQFNGQIERTFSVPKNTDGSFIICLPGKR